MLRIRTLIVLLFLSYLSFGQRGEFEGSQNVKQKIILPSIISSKNTRYTNWICQQSTNLSATGKDEYFVRLPAWKR